MDIEKLKEAGVDYDEGLNRFMGSVDLYEKFLLRFPGDPSFNELKEAMENEDYKTAFKAGHTLKGTSGNLSLNDLYKATIPFVDALRDEEADYDLAKELYPKVVEEYNRVMAVLKEYVND